MIGAHFVYDRNTHLIACTISMSIKTVTTKCDRARNTSELAWTILHALVAQGMCVVLNQLLRLLFLSCLSPVLNAGKT